MSDRVDITIIGAGAVGLAVAAEAAREGREVYIVEKNEAFGREQSARNSEVIHSGIYYEPGSLKARLCVEGNRLIYETCKQTGIACRRCGKLIVAVDDFEAGVLERVYERGLDNGLPLKMLSRRELKRLEPAVEGQAAVSSPTTGIFDSYALMRYSLARAMNNGAQFAYKTRVTGLEKAPGGYEITVEDPSGTASFTTRAVVNCAGLHSDHIAEMAGIDIDRANYRQHWRKGEYYSVSGPQNRLINSLIYPVPVGISGTVHVCLDIDWRLRLGPLFYRVDELDYGVDESKKEIFLKSSLLKALPCIGPDDISPESSGIMAVLQGEKEGFRDFVIRHEADRGLPGFINLIGIESPGLTSSPAIGRYVGQLLDDFWKN